MGGGRRRGGRLVGTHVFFRCKYRKPLYRFISRGSSRDAFRPPGKFFLGPNLGRVNEIVFLSTSTGFMGARHYVLLMVISIFATVSPFLLQVRPQITKNNLVGGRSLTKLLQKSHFRLEATSTTSGSASSELFNLLSSTRGASFSPEETATLNRLVDNFIASHPPPPSMDVNGEWQLNAILKPQDPDSDDSPTNDVPFFSIDSWRVSLGTPSLKHSCRDSHPSQFASLIASLRTTLLRLGLPLSSLW
jgi:hypothetical protein